MDAKERDCSAATARHWVGVYTQLERVAAIGEGSALDPEATIRMSATRSRLAARRRFWQLRLRRFDSLEAPREEFGS